VTVTASITQAVERAALAALVALPTADPLVPGTPTTSVAPLSFPGIAVSARFGGSLSGEVLVAVEQSIADALQNSPLGSLDIAAALSPALEAAAGTLGSVASGPGQTSPLGPALESLMSNPHAAVVPLTYNGQIRALVGLAFVDEAIAGAPSTPSYPTRAEMDRGAPGEVRTFTPPNVRNGLEMLRDVAMEVTAQIGSTRMTVSELLTLSDGAVVELDRAAGAPADLLVNGHLIARGEVVVVDENFGLRITEIISSEIGAGDQS
jgi:flagellar motor switch protein FliN/FliY